MKKIALFIFLLCSTVSFAQKKDMRNGAYSIYLISVDNPKSLSEGKIDTVGSTYEDSLIKITWAYAISQIEFALTNKSDQTLKVVWDDAAFVSMTNETGKIFHKGIKYIDRENSQPPSSIYKGTTLSDLIAPTSYVSYSSGQYGGWTSKPLIPAKGSFWSKKVEYEPTLIGQTMKVVLPIKKDDQTFEYAFTFKTKFIETER